VIAAIEQLLQQIDALRISLDEPVLRMLVVALLELADFEWLSRPITS
jgi:hypothetical protein